MAGLRPSAEAALERRRRLVVLGGMVAVCLAAVVVAALFGDRVRGGGDRVASSASGELATGQGDAVTSTSEDAATTTTTATSTTTTTTPIPASQRELVEIDRIGGTISPKSIVASGNGRFVAQNMMYNHTVTVYDRDFRLLATIDDTIVPADWGFDFEPGVTLRGAPVEATFSPDGAKAYVSNYHMYGGGYGPEPSDGCPQMSSDASFVYRIDMESLAIDQVVRVGTVPKFLAMSPDGSRVVVANWCSYDLSVIDTTSGTEIARVPAGRYPRGIVFSPSGDTAYVAVMGGDAVLELDMATNTVSGSFGLSGSPRHLVISPDGAHLFVTLNRAGDVAKVDIATRAVVGRIATGAAPRSMTMSDDGEAIYVVNYNADTVSKVLTATLEEVQEIPVAHHPIGITYDDDTDRVWVASYGGVITVFEDRPSAGAGT